jgi:hypothetical protein
MTLCPIALVVGCEKCPAFRICPLTKVLGDVPKTVVAAPAPKVVAAPVPEAVGAPDAKVAEIPKPKAKGPTSRRSRRRP